MNVCGVCEFWIYGNAQNIWVQNKDLISFYDVLKSSIVEHLRVMHVKNVIAHILLYY